MVKGFVVKFGPSPPGQLGGAPVLGFIGPGEPGKRTVDEKRKAKARARRKQARAQNRRGR